MIEIKSESGSFMDEQGDVIPLFSIFMTRNGVTYNCCVSANNFNDGEAVLQTLIPMISELTEKLYPEMNDELIKAKKRLASLKNQLIHTEDFVRQLEKANKDKR